MPWVSVVITAHGRPIIAQVLVMELEGSKLSSEALKGAPVLMPWRKFASWIGMDVGVVEGWIRVGYIPRIKIGNRVMVNVTLLNQRLLDGEACL